MVIEEQVIFENYITEVLKLIINHAKTILRKMNNITNFLQFSIASITTIIKQCMCREEEKDSIVKNIMK